MCVPAQLSLIALCVVGFRCEAALYFVFDRTGFMLLFAGNYIHSNHHATKKLEDNGKKVLEIYLGNFAPQYVRWGDACSPGH